jgi:RimJ/RimL family protein N-acetyltransferase
MASDEIELAFRPFRDSDADALLSWARTADELLQWTGPRFSFPLDQRQLREYAASAGDRRRLISAVSREGDVVLGHAALEILPAHELGEVRFFAVAPAARGRGIAGKLLEWVIALAFEQLALHRLELVVFPFNEAAVRCYKRAGFREEGRAREARKASDGYWDLLYMGLLRDWRERPRS